MTADTYATVHALLLAEADAQKAMYPQYKGHFDEWVVVRCTRNITARKGGRLLTKGQLVLGNLQLDERLVADLGESTFAEVYVAQHPYLTDGCMCIIDATRIEAVQIEADA